MKQVKRILSLLLAAVMAVSLVTVPVGAAAPTSDRETKAQVLFALGLFKGYDTTGTNFGLSDGATREQALLFLIRILGEEKAAEAWSGTQPYSDVPASDYFKPYIGYAKSKGYTNGIGNNKFGMGQSADMTQMAAFALRGLGYSEAAGDFTYPNSVPFALSLGIIDSAVVPAFFTRGDAVDILDGAVAAKVKNQSYTLLEKLVNSGAVTQAQIEAAAAIANGTTPGKSDIAAGTYTLGCMGNSLCMTSGKLELRDTDPAQKFTITSKNGYSYIQTAEGDYVGVTDVAQGTQPVIGTTPYSWLIQKISTDVYTLRPAEKPEMLVCAGDASSKNGTQMLLWPHTDNAKHGLITFTDVTKKVAVTGIKLDQTTAAVTVGRTVQLTGTISPSNATNKSVTWASGSPTVAKVDSSGVVTGVKAGTATITAKTVDGSKSAICKVTVTAAQKLTKSAVTIRNQTGKSITEMYITDSSLSKYDGEFLKENGYTSLSHNKFFTGTFEFYADTKFDILLRFSDGTEAEALGLPFSKATSSPCDLTLGTKEAILSRNGVTLARVNFESKANDLDAKSKALTDRYNKSMTRYNTLIDECRKLKLDQDPAFVNGMNAVTAELEKMAKTIGEGIGVLTDTQIKEFTANLNDLDTFMTEMETLIKNVSTKPDMTATNRVVNRYNTAIDAYNALVNEFNPLPSKVKDPAVVKALAGVTAGINTQTAQIAAETKKLTVPLTAGRVTEVDGNAKAIEDFNVTFRAAIDAAKAEASKPVSKTVPITIINNTGIKFSSIGMSPDTASYYDIVSNSDLNQGERVTVNIDFTGKSLVWDMQIIDEGSNSMDFKGINFTKCPTTGGTITLNWDGKNGTAKLGW